MAAGWFKNDIIPSRRTCDLIIFTTGGAYAPRETNFNGYVYLFQSTPVAIKGLGTITNKRLPLTFAGDTIDAVDVVNNRLQINAHPFEIGDGPFTFTVSGGGALPGNILPAQPYYINPFDANNVRISTTLDDCYAGTFVDIGPSAGTPTINIIDATGSASRGMDGEFQYQATQPETDVDASEQFVVVNKPGFDIARTSVGMLPAFQGFDALCEGSNTAMDILRVIFAAVTGQSGDYTTGTYSFKDPTTGTKTRVTITADATGRLVVTLGDVSGP